MAQIMLADTSNGPKVLHSLKCLENADENGNFTC